MQKLPDYIVHEMNNRKLRNDLKRIDHISRELKVDIDAFRNQVSALKALVDSTLARTGGI